MEEEIDEEEEIEQTIEEVIAYFYGIGPLFFISASLYILTTVIIFFLTNLRKLDSIKEVSES